MWCGLSMLGKMLEYLVRVLIKVNKLVNDRVSAAIKNLVA